MNNPLSIHWICGALSPDGRWTCTLEVHHGQHLALSPSLRIYAAWDETGEMRLRDQPDDRP